MVAARSADRAPDVAVASELRTLLHAHTFIADPRWRADALVRLIPALHRFDIATHKHAAELRELVRRAVCPAPLRAALAELVARTLDHAPVLSLCALVGALWSHSWTGAALTAPRSCSTAAAHLPTTNASHDAVASTGARRAARDRDDR